VTAQAAKALSRLADAGIPLGNQTVLLKGVNDNPAVMRMLVQKLLRCRVRPYYIYQADQVAGTEHLRTTVAQGLAIIENLQGWTSGLAVPHYVIDTPGGGGKVPLLPAYVESISAEQIVMRNYEGKRYVYKQPACIPDGKIGKAIAGRPVAARPARATSSTAPLKAPAEVAAVRERTRPAPVPADTPAATARQR
ncbi:MAG: hypothetical protein HYV36_07385, partial [Lentisphaerae bacterium]|nr:hypothetical protein [Lentisphaerota bacterium]